MLERAHQIYIFGGLGEPGKLFIDELQHHGVSGRAVLFGQEVSDGRDGLLVLRVHAEEVEDHAGEDVTDVRRVVQRETRFHDVRGELGTPQQDPVSALDGLLVVAFVYLDVVLDEQVDGAQRLFQLDQVLRVVVQTVLAAGSDIGYLSFWLDSQSCWNFRPK